MSNKNFQVYLDCGSSKMRAAAFNKNNIENSFYYESDFLYDYKNIDSEIEKIISFLEENTKEYLNDVNLIIDSTKMLSVGISVYKKIDGVKLEKEDIQFLIQDAKHQILRNYFDYNITHTIIKNYKIDNIEHNSLPDDINCNFISLDIFFICLPKKTIEYFKRQFFKLDLSVNHIFCSSYAKSSSYKENFSKVKNLSFIDIGFNKTSISCYSNNEIISLDVLPIGGNHITKDISKVLKMSLKEAEEIKLSFDKNNEILEKKKISLDLIQQIIFARVEELLELSDLSIKLNFNFKTPYQYKMILMGEGSKILDNKYKEKISFSNNIDFLDETGENICQSASKLLKKLNKEETVLSSKKLSKQGFFEKLFHFFE